MYSLEPRLFAGLHHLDERCVFQVMHLEHRGGTQDAAAVECSVFSLSGKTLVRSARALGRPQWKCEPHVATEQDRPLGLLDGLCVTRNGNAKFSCF